MLASKSVSELADSELQRVKEDMNLYETRREKSISTKTIKNGNDDTQPSSHLFEKGEKTLSADHVLMMRSYARSRRRPAKLFQFFKDSCLGHFFQAIFLWLCATLCWAASGTGHFYNDASQPLPDVLTDTPNVIYLKDWFLSSHDQVYSNLSASGVIPGDVLSILLNHGIIQDPYHDRNFLTQRHIWMGGEKDTVDGNFTNRQWTTTWIYSTTFLTPYTNDTESLSWKVIFEGVKMGADVLVNGIKVGEGQYLPNEIFLSGSMLKHPPS
jgi:hypothetical protein